MTQSALNSNDSNAGTWNTINGSGTEIEKKDGIFDKLFELGKQKSAREKIRKELEEKENKKDKINILIVWRGWTGHDAPDLTDTIILASINKSSKLISLLSIPRDLYVDYGMPLIFFH